MVTFPAHAVLAAHARSFISSMTRELAIDNTTAVGSPRHPSIWAAFRRAVKHSPVVLESSLLMLIFKEWGEGAQQRAECRQVGLHMLPFNAWGVQFKACRNGCSVVASDISFCPDGEGKIRCVCKLCGWKSCRLKHTDVKEMVLKLCDELPSVCWHPYPPSPHLLSAFSRLTKERRK